MAAFERSAAVDSNTSLCSHLVHCYQPPRFVQTQPFLVLQRAHGRQRSEMMVEGRCTHIDLRCEILDSQRLCEVTLQPIDCLRDLVTLASRERHLAQTRALIAHK